jgi:beta-glucanase (GH16 family)
VPTLFLKYIAMVLAMVGAAVSPSKAPVHITAATVAPAYLAGSDDFTGTAGTSPNSGLWTALTGGSGWGNGELEQYTARPANVSLNGAGDLSITAKKETYTGSDGITRNYTSARIISKVPVLYGYIEARIFLPTGQGLWPAFWTIGSDVYQGVQWPYTGEIDAMESVNDMSTLSASIHGPAVTTAYAITNTVRPTGGLAGSWHTYAVNWTSTAITWYMDGVQYAQVTKSGMPTNDVWEFSQPQLIQFDLAVGGTGPGAPTAQTPAQASMLVDYVHVTAAH